MEQAGFVVDADGSLLHNPDDDLPASSNPPPPSTDKFALRFVRP
jgi:predicted methyltransferase